MEEPFWADASGGWLSVLFGGGRFIKVWPPSLVGFSEKMNAVTRLVIYTSVMISLLLVLLKSPWEALFVLLLGGLLVGSIVLYHRAAIQNQLLPIIDKTVTGFQKGVHEPINNPYANPMPYEPGIAVRSSVPPKDYLVDDCLAKLYRGTSEWDQNLFFNQIPDPTLIARPVFWPEDPRPDIVSNEAACADRKCR